MVTYEHFITRIEEKIRQYKEKGLQVFATSSFQTHSIPMLHVISQIEPELPVYFLNTGFHFPESLQYKNQVKEVLGLNVIDLVSPISKASQRDGENRFFFASNPDYCCYLNKILPLEPILAEKDVWISGVRKSQNQNRKNFKEEEASSKGVIRYHPMLEWDDRMIYKYIKDHDLPKHPLDGKGYLSIGCSPCTRKFDPDQFGSTRDGRWAGLNKTECGLHTDLIKKD